MAKVMLIAYTPDPERTVAAAAKLCYSARSVDKLLDGLTPEKTAGFLEMLAQLGHASPTEHASFTFGIEGVSRSLLAQITRHRIASYSVQSQRYVRADQFEYVTPPEIAALPQAAQEFQQAMAAAQQSYDRLAALLQEKHTRALLDQGVPEGEARRRAEKQAIEDARFVLPNACATKLVMTMNARSLQNFFAERCCSRAQWEIRQVADQMLALVSQVAPTLFAQAGPGCVRGACPEGKMSCGRADQVRRRMEALRGGRQP